MTAQIIWGNQALARKIGASYYYYLYNGHGDVVQIVNEAGTIVNSYSYDEWGNITSQTEGITNELKYCGEPYDTESGMYYLRARYYDPTTGRFISQDSNEGDITNPLSLNLYTYCYNNPVIYMDYTGNGPIKTISDFGARVGKQLNQVNENYIVPYYDNDGTFRGVLKSTGKAVGTGIAVKVAIIIPIVAPAEMEKVATSTTKGAGKSANITNDILKAPRAGSALKLDSHHAFNDIVDNYAGLATKTPIKNGTLYQLEGSLNGVQGRFEWIIDSTGQYAGQVSHRYFVSGGTLNGVPIKP